MNSYYVEATRNTPMISLDPETGEFEIRGRSFPDDPLGFYLEVYTWLEEYVKHPGRKTRLVFNSDYFNTASYKSFVEILRILENVPDGTHDVSVTWYYEKDDDEIREAGEDLQEVCMLPIAVKRLPAKKDQ